MVAESEFREDLVFRINTFEITLPSLRERVEDLPVLAGHLLARTKRGGRGATQFSPEALRLLATHHWPGNVRELANVIERASILCDGQIIGVEHLPDNFDARHRLRTPQLNDLGSLSLRDLEMQAIHQALARHAGNKPKAADELGISLKTLYNKLNQTSGLKETA
jgi:two-component system NtrC family response regulator